MNTSIRSALIQTIARMSETEALAVYQALGQWYENTSVGLDESDTDMPEFAWLPAAEDLVNACEQAICNSVDGELKGAA